MTDQWRCRSCLRDFPSKAFAVLHRRHWPNHDILHLESEPDIFDEEEPVTLAEVLEDPSQENQDDGSADN